MRFPTKPNGKNPLGDQCFISNCGKFRIFEAAGGGWYAHMRRLKNDHWEPLQAWPFQSRTSAIAACRALGQPVFNKPAKKRTWRVEIHADSL